MTEPIARSFTVDLPYSVFTLADKFTDKHKDARPTLACVCINLSTGHAIAADGFILAKVPVTVHDVDGEIAPKSYVLIHRDDFARAKKLAKRGRPVKLGITNFASDGLGVTVKFIVNDGKSDTIVPVTAHSGTYFDVNQIIPGEREGEVSITLNPDNLAALAALAKATDQLNPRLTFRIPANPTHAVHAMSPDGTVLLTMPIDPMYATT